MHFYHLLEQNLDALEATQALEASSAAWKPYLFKTPASCSNIASLAKKNQKQPNNQPNKIQLEKVFWKDLEVAFEQFTESVLQKDF